MKASHREGGETAHTRTPTHTPVRQKVGFSRFKYHPDYNRRLWNYTISVPPVKSLFYIDAPKKGSCGLSPPVGIYTAPL